MTEIDALRLVTWGTFVLLELTAWPSWWLLRRANGTSRTVRCLIDILALSALGVLVLAVSREWYTPDDVVFDEPRLELLIAGTLVFALIPFRIGILVLQLRREGHRHYGRVPLESSEVAQELRAMADRLEGG